MLVGLVLKQNNNNKKKQKRIYQFLHPSPLSVLLVQRNTRLRLSSLASEREPLMNGEYEGVSSKSALPDELRPENLAKEQNNYGWFYNTFTWNNILLFMESLERFIFYKNKSKNWLVV